MGHPGEGERRGGAMTMMMEDGPVHLYVLHLFLYGLHLSLHLYDL